MDAVPTMTKAETKQGARGALVNIGHWASTVAAGMVVVGKVERLLERTGNWWSEFYQHDKHNLT